MYKLKKEYFDQEVVVYTPNNKVIKLDNATQEQFAEAFKIKGNEKFISNGKKETKGKKSDNKPKDDAVVYTEEDINNAIADGNYDNIVVIVGKLSLFNGKGRPSKADAIKLLETYLEDNK